MLVKKKFVVLGLLAAAAVFGLLVSVRFDLEGRGEGLFILRKRDGFGWVVKDDLFLGEGPRLLTGIPFRTACSKKGKCGPPFLECQWDEADGNGYVRSVLADSTEMHFYFSRFTDDYGIVPHGMFVGGGLPSSVKVERAPQTNDTGISFFDGRRWFHLWCNVNEGIGSAWDRRRVITPSAWRFLGSEVLHESPEKVVIASYHALELDGVPLRVERYGFFIAGDTFFKLSIRITNQGDSPVPYFYLYGDEPWVGDYGSSSGSVGWVMDRLISFEGAIDLKQNTFAGMVNVDIGSANFVEWLGSLPPDMVYFANQNGHLSPSEMRVPLESNERFLGMVWGPRVLHPGKTDSIYLALGKADFMPFVGLPHKPPVPLALPLQ